MKVLHSGGQDLEILWHEVGVLPQPLSGEEVNEMAEQSAPHFSSLILGCLERL